MSKFKINIGKPDPSESEMAQYKNFDYVYKPYQESQTGSSYGRYLNGSTPKFLSILIGTTVILIGSYLINKLMTPKVEQPVQIETTITTPFVNPPIENVNVAFQEFEVDVVQGGTFTYLSGSKITIPVNAFINGNGNPILGKVTMKYREFHDHAEIFASGITMEYDSAGLVSDFESAGMMEIIAFQNNTPVYIAKNKKVDIEMISNNNESRFNLYYLDTAQRKWVYKGKDQIIQRPEDRMDIAQELPQSVLKESDIELPLPIQIPIINEPIKPKTKNKNRFTFIFQVDPKAFPEIAVYDSVEWEYADVGDNFDPQGLYDITWQDVKLIKQEDNTYIVQLTHKNRKESHKVFPVYSGKDLEKAESKYKLKYKEYLKALDKKEELEKQRKEEYEKKRADIEEKEKERIAYLKKQAELRRQQVKWANAQTTMVSTVSRVFSIMTFGTWNCDSRVQRPQGIKVTASFKTINNEKLTLTNVYLIDKKINAIFPIHEIFSFNPNAENYIVGLVYPNKLAYFSPKDFDRIDGYKLKKVGLNNFTFTMHTTEKPISSVDEIKEIIGKL